MNKRTLTVYAGSGKGCSYISQIILQGKWLEALGFSIGDKITVDCQQGRIVIEKEKPLQK
ncbi:SymE family type I addiction module toxin [Lachnospiraceae bacterium 66-29]|jgi:toxic protein SymE|nr:type I toxin-antitoxin system SymE family toxin [Eubacterium sp.]